MYKNNNTNMQITAPGTIQCLLDTSDQGSGYVNDYWAALVEEYRAYLQCLTQWANEMGLQYSFQVSYNMPLDALTSISEVNTPECESLQFQDSIKDIGNLPVITALLWEISRAVAGGVNQDYVGTTWPGNAPFKYLVSDLYSEKQPSWNHGQPKFDAVVYNKDSATDPTFSTHYNETDLIDEGTLTTLATVYDWKTAC
ncbi:uncharacterized protein BDW43DRAFT_305041 [Aspergillus alliaceus]|uniref:uncharacterized protein n=1 Tax=Petromyces alliaceus TaxID=209559 RepID=UPI0012A73CF0|nr:uncharacterized protein BDW43DRAFT_305041 [Aspergillus alliaceus]KAB8226846.1 hypothetical protein BDW43DRAFT_305041 [Aspergillus alliaceus]